MAKKYYEFTYELSIDGEPYPAEKALPFFQRDPFPGGHTYSCVITGKRLGKYFSDTPSGRRAKVTEKEAGDLLQQLALGWGPNSEGVSVDYFLNSVEEIDFEGDRLRFSGICSPVIRNPKAEA